MVIIGTKNVPASKKLAPELGKHQQRTLANAVHHVRTLAHQSWHIGGTANTQLASHRHIANQQAEFGDLAPQSRSQQGPTPPRAQGHVAGATPE